MIASAKKDASALVDRLEFRRHLLKMSKAALARRSGVSLPTVDRILTGKEQRPAFDCLLAIARALGVEIQMQETQGVHEFRKARAQMKAVRIARMVQGTMGLESQGVDTQALDDMVEQTACELLAGPQRNLWND